MKKSIALMLAVLLVITALSGCVLEGDIALLSNTEIHTTIGGIYITLDSISGVGEDEKIVATWHNETDNTVCYGLHYDAQYFDGETYKSVMRRDVAFPELACILEPHSENSQSYATKNFSTLRRGTYRIVVDFNIVSNENSICGESYAEFEIK